MCPFQRRRLPRSSASTTALRTGSTGSSYASHASARRALHQAGVDAARGLAGIGEQDIGICNGQVVASDCDIEVVLQSQSNGVVERQHELAVLHELFNTGCVA